jgi:hypothetical protein
MPLRASSCVPQVQKIPSTAASAGQTPSLPLFVYDGATTTTVTAPFTQCPLRSEADGSCTGAPADWTITSAATFFAATSCGGPARYDSAATDAVLFEVSRMCFEETAGLSAAGGGEGTLVPRPGVCGSGSGSSSLPLPPLTLYLRAYQTNYFILTGNAAFAWADAWSYNWSVTMSANASTLRLALSPSLCAGTDPAATCE